MSFQIKDSRAKKIPVSEITTPKAGRVCYLASWWTVTPNDEVIMWKGHSPQCHAVESIARYLQEKLWPECSVRFIDVAFVKSGEERGR